MKHTIEPSDIQKFCTALHHWERSAATIEKYRRTLTAFYAWLPSDKAVEKETVMAYKASLAARYAPAGVNTALAALNGLFRFLGWEECRVKPLKIQRRVFASKEKELSRGEYERLVTAAEKSGKAKLALLLQVMAATGVRVSEVADITLEAARAGKTEISLKGKIRTILLPGKLCRKLLKYANHQKIVSGALFRTRNDRVMNRKEIWAQMKTLCLAAEVEPGKVFPHNLRHLFARVFYQAQKDIAKLADLLGHSSVETTRIYLLSSGEEHMQALDRLKLVC